MPGRQSWCGKEVPLPYEMSECRRARFQNRLEQALATLCFASHRSVEALPEAPAGPMFKASQRGAQIGHSGWGLRDRRGAAADRTKIGRASCRERVCQYV